MSEMTQAQLYSVKFGNIELNNSEFSKIAIHDFEAMPQITRNISQVTSAHRSVVTSRWFTSKKVTITLYTSDCTTELQAKIARIRQVLQKKTDSLQLNRGLPVLSSGNYEYNQWKVLTYLKATLDTVDFTVNGRIMTADISFTILDPVGISDELQTIFSSNGVTVATTSINVPLIDGTFEVQYPVYRITVNSITQGTNKSIAINNQFNTLTYTGDLVAGDVLELDTYSASLTRNGNLVDYSGSIPTLPLTQSLVDITDTYTSRNIDILITNQARYI